MPPPNASLPGRRAALAGLALLAVVLTGSAAAGGLTAGRPRIVPLEFALVGHSPAGPRYFVTVEARFRACAEPGGPLTAVIREREGTGRHALAAVEHRQTLPHRARSCRTYRLRWRLADRFFGAGWYIVGIRMQDVSGVQSKPIGRAWLTRD